MQRRWLQSTTLSCLSEFHQRCNYSMGMSLHAILLLSSAVYESTGEQLQFAKHARYTVGPCIQYENMQVGARCGSSRDGRDIPLKNALLSLREQREHAAATVPAINKKWGADWANGLLLQYLITTTPFLATPNRPLITIMRSLILKILVVVIKKPDKKNRDAAKKKKRDNRM